METFVRRLLNAVLLALLAPMAAFAQPVITNEFVFTENRSTTSVFSGGHTFVIGATGFTSPFGIASASATHVGGGGPNYTLNHVPGPLFPDQYALRTAYSGQTGQWNYSATDNNGLVTNRLSHILDDVRVLPLITGVSVTGSYLAPRITWDAVDPTLFPSFCGGPVGACALGFDFFNYQVEVRQITGTPGNAAPIAYNSIFMPTTIAGTPGTLTPTVFDLPTGVLAEGNSYLIGVRLNHNELEAFLPNNRFFSPTENRSVSYFEHSATAPIPEPETYALMLAGLGLLGWHAKRRKQKEAALA